MNRQLPTCSNCGLNTVAIINGTTMGLCHECRSMLLNGRNEYLGPKCLNCDKHTVSWEIIGRCLHEFRCRSCGEVWQVDSSD